MTEREYCNPIQHRPSRLGIAGTLGAIVLGTLAFTSTPSNVNKSPTKSRAETRYSNALSNSNNSKTISYKTSDFSTDSDEVLLARAIFGEARNTLYKEKIAVGYTVKNRATDEEESNGESIRESALMRKQYSCFNPSDDNLAILKNPDKYSPEAFRECLKASREILDGTTPDPTNGSKYYYSPEGMRAIRIDEIERKYEAKIAELKKTKGSRKKLKKVNRQFQLELKKARTEEPPKPYWAKPPLQRIGKIKVGTNSKGKPIYSEHVFYK